MEVIWIDETDSPRPGVPDALQIADLTKPEKPLDTTDFVIAQETDLYCKEISIGIGKVKSDYTYDSNRVLIRHSELDWALQKIVPATPPARQL